MPPSASGLSSQEELRGLMPDVPEDSTLLENLHRNFIETRNSISEPRRVEPEPGRGEVGKPSSLALPMSRLCPGSWVLP